MKFKFRIRYPVLVLFGIYVFQALAFAVVYQQLHRADLGCVVVQHCD
jgi:hypothetical protein